MFDRDAAREVLRQRLGQGDWTRLLDALAGCVRPVPPQTIDRAKALKNAEAALVGYRVSEQLPFTSEVTAVVDAVLALAVPDSRFDTIRALHYRVEVIVNSNRSYCSECMLVWPCATVRALDGDATT